MEQLRQDGQRQQLIYDGANRLIEVLLHDGRRSRYRYDALGRRLAQTTEGASGAPMRYHGWDGDRLVHTEQVDATQPGQRHITHTVYEPETFTPLVQLSATASAQAKPQALMLMARSQDEDEHGDDNAQMAQMLDALPQDMRQALDNSLRRAAREGLPKRVLALMPDQGQNTIQRLTGLREQLEKQEQSERTPITIRHYHCDHLGTPLALTDQNHNIVWAARLDPWGNVQEEFNPGNIEQSIRLPGQQHDKDTNLFYNRHRYYDPAIGAYINQDPIGWLGGISHYIYPSNPNTSIDSLGLQGSVLDKAKDVASKVIDYGGDIRGFISGRKAAEKHACLCKAISERRIAWEELVKKLASGQPMSDWDNAALTYLDKQRKIDALTAMRIGFEFGSDMYTSIGTSGGWAGAIRSTAIEGVAGATVSTPSINNTAHAAGRGPWKVAVTNECE